MIINLLKLKLNQISQIDIDDTITIDEEYYKDTDIKNISEVKVKGKIIDHGEDEYEILLNVKCDLTLTCSISLEDVIEKVDIDISEYISSIDENMEENNKIINNTIDLIPIIWQNILLEVPLKVIGPNVDRSKLHGDGWKLITNEEESKEEIDPRLEKLKDFIND